MRRQPPVHSPVTWRGLAAGFRAALRADPEAPAALEAVVRSRYGARAVLLTDSGTTALRLAIEGALAGSAGPVALPAYGCYDLATAAIGAGASVVLYDVDPATSGPDLGTLEALRPLRPAAVVVAHWFGHLADPEAAGAVLPDAVLIEDAAQGVGGMLRGRPLGSFGSLAVLSFGRGKGTTGGGGGALLGHDERGSAIVEAARRRLRASSAGITPMIALAAQHALGRPSLYWLPASLPFLHLGETIYHPPREPRAATPTSVAVLRSVWAEAEREVVVRRRHGERLRAALSRSSVLQPFTLPPAAEPGYLRVSALTRHSPPAELLDRRSTALGVEVGYPAPLATLPSLTPRLVRTGLSLSGATRLAAGLVTLPTHRYLAERDLRRLEAWLEGRNK